MEISSIIQGEQCAEVEVNEVQEVKKKLEVKGIEVNGGAVEVKNHENQLGSVLETAIKAIGNRKAKLTLHIELIE